MTVVMEKLHPCFHVGCDNPIEFVVYLVLVDGRGLWWTPGICEKCKGWLASMYHELGETRDGQLIPPIQEIYLIPVARLMEDRQLGLNWRSYAERLV